MGCKNAPWEAGVRGDYKNKLCPALACTFNVTDIQNICSRDENGQISTDATNISRADFTTQNGFSWQIGPAPEDEVNSDEPYLNNSDVAARYLQVVLVDVDPENQNVQHCVYDANNCPNPTIFKFFVTADGNVIIGDAMGLMYNLTRKSLTRNDRITPQTEITVGIDDNGNDVQVKPTDKISTLVTPEKLSTTAYIQDITQADRGNSANGQCPAGGTQSDETDGDAD